MNENAIHQSIEKYIQIEKLDEKQFADKIDGKLKETERSPAGTIYEFDLTDPVFSHGELRLDTSGEWAILILQPSDDAQVEEDDLGLERWGEIRHLNINPDVPPEGIIEFTYEADSVLITFLFSEGSRILDSVILEWGETT